MFSKWRAIRWPAWAGIAALLLLSAGMSIGQATDPANPVANPHWNKDACITCHVGQSEFKAITITDAELLCIKCHNGRTTTAEKHPIARTLSKPRFIDNPWPTNAGKISCLTCHDMKLGCAADAQRPYDNTAMLRPATVKRTDESDAPFCLSCHKPDALPRHNPHRMIDENKKIVEARCLDCHTRVLDASIRQRTEKPELRENQTTLCRSCHPQHKEWYKPGHVGDKVKPDMLAMMRVRELIGLAAPMRQDLLDQLKTTNVRPTMMHLGKGDLVQCSTCHNPHQQGVMQPGTSLGYRPMKLIDGKMVSQMRGPDWCNHCHEGK